jgi:hypothetical protein
MRYLAAALVLPLLLCGPAYAQPSCPVPPAAWGTNVALTSATASADLASARLSPDRAATVSLHPVGEVRFTAPPEKRGDASSYGGMLEMDVREAGTYQVSLSAGAWIDVLKDGLAVASTAHGHGEECSGLRKMVSFSLMPGRHVIQLSGNKEDSIRVLISPKSP